MGRNIVLFSILMSSAAVSLVPQTQQQESLGDLARQIRITRNKEAKKTTKLFTNDNLPPPVFGEAVTRMAPSPEQISTQAENTPKLSTAPSSEDTANKEPNSPEDKSKTRDYWQGKFAAARRDVAKAKEQLQLSEDELNLLQLQQAREMDPITKEDLTGKVQAKQSEVDTNDAALEAAQTALNSLEKDFRESGARADWSQTE